MNSPRTMIIRVASILLGALPMANAAADDFVDAIVRGDVAEVCRLLEQGANPNQVSTETSIVGPLLNPDVPLHRRTPVLMLAIEAQSVEIVRALLDAGADPNRGDFRRATPLARSVTQGPKAARIVQLLLEHGADPNLQFGEDGALAIEIALMGGTLDVPLVLLPVTDQRWLSDQLVLNSRQGDFGPLFFAVADMFRRRELPIREGNLDAFPPLIRAVLTHDAARVEQLLRDLPGCAEERDRFGFTALMWASSRFGTREIAQRLLDSNADPNAVGDGRWTALFAATEANDAGVIQMLCDAGADTNASIEYQRPRHPLIAVAAGNCSAAAFKALLESGADPLIYNSDGTSAIVARAVNNRSEERELIIELAKAAFEQAKSAGSIGEGEKDR